MWTKVQAQQLTESQFEGYCLQTEWEDGQVNTEERRKDGQCQAAARDVSAATDIVRTGCPWLCAVRPSSVLRAFPRVTRVVSLWGADNPWWLYYSCLSCTSCSFLIVLQRWLCRCSFVICSLFGYGGDEGRRQTKHGVQASRTRPS